MHLCFLWFDNVSCGTLLCLLWLLGSSQPSFKSDWGFLAFWSNYPLILLFFLPSLYYLTPIFFIPDQYYSVWATNMSFECSFFISNNVLRWNLFYNTFDLNPSIKIVLFNMQSIETVFSELFYILCFILSIPNPVYILHLNSLSHSRLNTFQVLDFATYG